MNINSTYKVIRGEMEIEYKIVGLDVDLDRENQREKIKNSKELSSTDKLKANYDLSVSDIVSIKGLTFDNKEITVEDIKAGKLPYQIVICLIDIYQNHKEDLLKQISGIDQKNG